MDINQMPSALSRTVQQRLMHDQTFDAFVLERLWFMLPGRTQALLGDSRAWYFGEAQIAEHWRVPALVVLFRGTALLAQQRYRSNLVELANACKLLTDCDRLHVLGQDTGIRLWFDYQSSHWHRQPLPRLDTWPEEG